MWDDDDEFDLIERLTKEMKRRIAAGEMKAAYAEMCEAYGWAIAKVVQRRCYMTSLYGGKPV